MRWKIDFVCTFQSAVRRRYVVVIGYLLAHIIVAVERWEHISHLITAHICTDSIYFFYAQSILKQSKILHGRQIRDSSEIERQIPAAEAVLLKQPRTRRPYHGVEGEAGSVGAEVACQSEIPRRRQKNLDQFQRYVKIETRKNTSTTKQYKMWLGPVS